MFALPDFACVLVVQSTSLFQISRLGHVLKTHILTVFPGGILPSLSVLHQTLTDGSNGRLVVESVSNIGPHYARTLREWRKRFLENFDEVIAPALREEHPEIMHAGADQAEREVQVFKRKWICTFSCFLLRQSYANHAPRLFVG